MLEAVSAAVKTLPKVVGQTRVGKLDTKAWPDYEFKLPLATLRKTMQPVNAYILQGGGLHTICLFVSSSLHCTAQLLSLT